MDKGDIFFARYILWLMITFVLFGWMGIFYDEPVIIGFLWVVFVISPNIVYFRKEMYILFKIWMRLIIGKELKQGDE